MPNTKIYEINGIKIRIYDNDHFPAHFHVIGLGIRFKVEIKTMEIIAGKDNRQADKIMQWAKDNQQMLQDEWEKIHG